MKKLTIYLSVPLLLVSALSAAATASPPDGYRPFPDPGMHGERPPLPMPVYAVTETTSAPVATLKNLVAQLPQADAGKYQVRIEILPLPAKPLMQGPEH